MLFERTIFALTRIVVVKKTILPLRPQPPSSLCLLRALCDPINLPHSPPSLLVLFV